MTYSQQFYDYLNELENRLEVEKRRRVLALAMSQNQGAIKEVLFKLFKKS